MQVGWRRHRLGMCTGREPDEQEKARAHLRIRHRYTRFGPAEAGRHVLGRTGVS
jgi:hypothetical protein